MFFFFYFFFFFFFLIFGVWFLCFVFCGLGIVYWAQSPIPNPQSPIPILFLIMKQNNKQIKINIIISIKKIFYHKKNKINSLEKKPI